jgi:hypothetical protein
MKKSELKNTIKEEIKKFLKEEDTPMLQPGVYQLLEYNIDGYDPINEYIKVSQQISEEEALRKIGYDGQLIRFQKASESKLPKIYRV